MKKIFYGSNLWNLRQIELLFWGYFCFSLFALIGEFFQGLGGFSTIFWLVANLIFFRFVFHVRKNLQYSYWALSGILLCYLILSLNSLVAKDYTLFIRLCYLFSIMFLCLEMYFLYSPIYYPLVRWWEYDFRFRDDLKIKVLVNERELSGRLTDLRRGAGCVALFEKYNHGIFLTISLEDFSEIDTIKAEIISRRQYSLGRPYTYGVRVLLDDLSSKRNYDSLVKYWKSRKRLLKKSKYSSEKS